MNKEIIVLFQEVIDSTIKLSKVRLELENKLFEICIGKEIGE